MEGIDKQYNIVISFHIFTTALIILNKLADFRYETTQNIYAHCGGNYTLHTCINSLKTGNMCHWTMIGLDNVFFYLVPSYYES